MTTEVFDLFLEGKVNLKQKGNHFAFNDLWFIFFNTSHTESVDRVNGHSSAIAQAHYRIRSIEENARQALGVADVLRGGMAPSNVIKKPSVFTRMGQFAGANE